MKDDIILDIKQEHFFPLHFRFFGILVLISGVIVWTSNQTSILVILVAITCILLGILIITARYGLLINASKRTYQVYTWLLGIKSGKINSFTSIEKIFINDVKEGSTMTSWAGQRLTVSEKVYKAFVKLDNGEKIHLDTDKNQDRLQERVNSYIQCLKDVIQTSP
jgi:hypothetical protein